jgi:hypothetical protein
MAAAMTPNASSANSTALGKLLTSRVNGPLFEVGVDELAGCRVAVPVGARPVARDVAATPAVVPAARATDPRGCPAFARREFAAERGRMDLALCPEGRTVPAVVREMAGAPVGEPAAAGDACGVVSRELGDGEDVAPLEGECDPDPTGGVLTGGTWTGAEGVLTGGVVTLGVVTCGVVTCGVVMGPAVTVGTDTVGTVTGGTVVDGTETVGSGGDAVAGVTGSTSAPTAATSVSAPRVEAPPRATTRDHLPHGLSTDDGADIAHRPRSRPLCSAGISGRFSLHPAGRLHAGPVQLNVRLSRSPTGVVSAAAGRARSDRCSCCGTDCERFP